MEEILKRVSVREYLDKKVEKEKVQKDKVKLAIKLPFKKIWYKKHLC